MSASQDKKTRTQQRAEGTERRQVAAQKKAKEDRKSRIRWILGTIAVVVLIAGILIGNSPLFYRQTAMKVAGENYSVADVNYYYNLAYQNFYSQYGSYASYFGLDTSKPLDSQEYTMSDEYDTWADYFMSEAKKSITQITALSQAAEDAGMTLSEEDQAQIDEQIASIAEYAESAGFNSASKYIQAVYGNGVNESVLRAQMEKSTLATNFSEQQQASYTYTADEIKAEYAEHADEYDTFNLSYYLVSAEVVESKDADGNDTSAPTDETMAAAKKTADEIAAAVKGAEGSAEDAFAALANEHSQDPGSNTNGGLYEHVYKGQMVPEFNDFCFASGRKAGDVDLVYNESTGYHLIYFVGENDRYCDYLAEQLLRTEDYNAWQEELLADYTAEDCFALRYAG